MRALHSPPPEEATAEAGPLTGGLSSMQRRPSACPGQTAQTNAAAVAAAAATAADGAQQAEGRRQKEGKAGCCAPPQGMLARTKTLMSTICKWSFWSEERFTDLPPFGHEAHQQIALTAGCNSFARSIAWWVRRQCLLSRPGLNPRTRARGSWKSHLRRQGSSRRRRSQESAMEGRPP